MNVNKWPLERVRRIEFETPLPLNECMRRLERLNEPQKLHHEATFGDATSHRWRIAVHRDVRFSGQVLYNIGMVFVTDPYTADTTIEEVRLKLLPQQYQTRVIIQYPEMWQIPTGIQQAINKVLLALMIVFVIGLIIANVMEIVPFSLFCYGLIIVPMLTLIRENRHYRLNKYQNKLLKRIYRVLDHTYHSPSAMERRKDKS